MPRAKVQYVMLFHSPICLTRTLSSLTVGEVPGDELEELVQEDDGQRELEHGDPLVDRQRSHLEHSLEKREIEGFGTMFLKKSFLLTAMKSTYSTTKWREKESAMAARRSGLIQGGITSRDWFSESELTALAISMVTRMERAMLIGSGAWKISQEIPLNLSGSLTQDSQWES